MHSSSALKFTIIPYKQWPAAILRIARYNTKSWTLQKCATNIIHAVVRGVCQLLVKVTNRKERNKSACKVTLQSYGSTTILRQETVRNDSGFGLIPKKRRELGHLIQAGWLCQVLVLAGFNSCSLALQKNTGSVNRWVNYSQNRCFFFWYLSVRCSNLSGVPHSRQHVIVQFLNRNNIISSTQIPHTESSLVNPHKVI